MISPKSWVECELSRKTKKKPKEFFHPELQHSHITQHVPQMNYYSRPAAVGRFRCLYKWLAVPDKSPDRLYGYADGYYGYYIWEAVICLGKRRQARE